MRHNKKINHLSRKSAHRKAMLSNMATSLILHKRIKTTVAKAKALRRYAEPLITKAKSDTTHARRVVFSYLRSKEAIKELFGDIASKIIDRPGGYTRILRIGNRLGDNAEICYIELVDYNENMLTSGKTDATTRRRTRRGGGEKKTDEVTTKEISADTKPEKKDKEIKDTAAKEEKTEKKPEQKEEKKEPKAKGKPEGKLKAENKKKESSEKKPKETPPKDDSADSKDKT